MTKHDVEIAKNYLQQEEIIDLELLVSQYLDFAERQARQHKVMYMTNWKVKLDAFLQLNEAQILTHAGNISAEMARELALSEYGKFEELRKKEIVMQNEEELSEALRNLLGYRESLTSSEQ